MNEELRRRTREQATGQPPAVVVGVDGSPASRCAALTAAGAARSLGGTVVAVHVPSPSAWQALACCLGAAPALTDLAGASAERIRSDLTSLFALEGVAWEFVVAHDAVHTSLLRAAEEHDAAMVVIGASCRSRWSRLAHLVIPDLPRLLRRAAPDRLLIS